MEKSSILSNYFKIGNRVWREKARECYIGQHNIHDKLRDKQEARNLA